MRRPSLQRDVDARQFGRRLHGRDRADRLLGAADVGAPARRIALHLAQLARDLGGGDVQRLQPRRVELDADLAVHAADPRDRADAGHGEQQRVTSLSTNQDSASSSMRLDATV